MSCRPDYFPKRALRRGRPQGIPPKAYADFSASLKSELGELADDIVIQGSRANGIANVRSDLDVGIRVSEDIFARLIRDGLQGKNAGSAAGRTWEHARVVGKINARQAGLASLRVRLEALLDIKIDLSIIERGGLFDRNPHFPVQ